MTPNPMSVLIDLETKRVLAAHATISAIMQLNECTPEGRYFTALGGAENADKVRASVSPGQIKWKYDMKAKAFVCDPKNISDTLVERAKLAACKLDAIYSILVYISSGRYKLRVGVDFGETVYMLKRFEAYAFKAAGYPDTDILEYPYVMQFADLRSITFKEAADEIIFASKMDDQVLLKTERMRLKFMPLVKGAKTCDEVRLVIDEFMKSFYIKALI